MEDLGFAGVEASDECLTLCFECGAGTGLAVCIAFGTAEDFIAALFGVEATDILVSTRTQSLGRQHVANTLLAAADSHKLPIEFLVPVDWQSSLSKGGVKGSAMPVAFSVGQDSVAVEDKRACP